MNRFIEGQFDAVVIGAGHAGCEAALALARTGFNTAMLTLNLDSIAFMACNPSIGGTAKGQIVREIDALGGEMGINADGALLQIRMLNRGKGAAVQSLRGQEDKNFYHTLMKKTLENTPNLKILQGEAIEILTDEDGKNVTGVLTSFGGILQAKSVIVATGVYLNGSVIAGEWRQNSGPNGFQSAANGLTENLIKLGFNVRRFKTGTPARVDARTIDFSVLEVQDGEKDVYPFSFMSERVPQQQTPCYLTYTNQKTHDIIRENLHRSPLYGGLIKGTGPRYCPSIEDKVVRFADKERHQLFLEPEGADTNEIYVQGMSTSLPHDVQKAMYRTVKGLENCEIMRYAYAIEYDCIDSLDLYPTLEYKRIEGLYTAGQINGTSGYEEAAAQGLIAGINASLKMRGESPLILSRDDGYIGVLIDDLVTKGTNEPYRMMTSRAEYRIVLRQDNPDFRLTEKGRKAGLVSDERYEVFLKRQAEYRVATEIMKETLKPKDTEKILLAHGFERAGGGLSRADLVRRGITLKEIIEEFGGFNDISGDILDTVEIDAKYEGYLQKGLEQIEKAKKLEEKLLPEDIDYLSIGGLRLEARQKLDKIRPQNLGQAGRISGVSPADIAVLMVYLKK
ncbi:MAG: tRNA uridine-5-carboxymethylaminomethyl(34) synthesis enzyme MnmG [Clostridiales bacterium]|nr:tRNA uridine-5-carboxymethylaminomethyl(34) synthesis enzyme MnmG [Clostridiales bacterium]